MAASGDRQGSRVRETWAPAYGAYAIAPDDDTDLNPATTGIYVGGAGNLTVTMLNGGPNVTFVGIAPGTVLPIRVTRVLVTDTTATSIVGLWT